MGGSGGDCPRGFSFRVFWTRQGFHARDYQVVVTQTGQTFFGIVTDMDRHGITMSDVYYPSGASSGIEEVTSASDVILRPIGNLFFTPTDELYVPMTTVESVMNLAPESSVRSAIERFQS